MMKKAMLFALSLVAVTGVSAFDFESFGSTGDTGGSYDTGDSSDDGYDWNIEKPSDAAGSAPSAEPANDGAFDGPDPFAKSRPLSNLGSPEKDMSVGLGLFFSGDFGGGVTYNSRDAQILAYDERVTPVYGFGLHTFFDYKSYVTAGLSLFWGGGSWEFRDDGKTMGAYRWKKASITSVNIDALGKYPFEINEKMTVFPLLGLAYHMVVSGENNVTDFNAGQGDGVKFDGKGIGIPKAIQLSALWFKFGGGLDYAINERLYIRSELMYGFRLANGYENDILAKGKQVTTANDISGTPRLCHGLTIRAGVGYNL